MNSEFIRGLTRCTSQNIERFTLSLQCNLSPPKIDMSSSGINCDEIIKFIIALENNTSLKKLDISLNPIRDDGLNQLRYSLSHNTSLTELNMLYISASNNAIVNFIKSLEYNTTIKILHIGKAYYYEEINNAIVSMLEKNFTIEQIRGVKISGIEKILSQENREIRRRFYSMKPSN